MVARPAGAAALAARDPAAGVMPAGAPDQPKSATGLQTRLRSAAQRDNS